MTETVIAPAATAVEVAPYALVRLAALSYPPAPPEADEFRRTLDRLVELRTWLASVAESLADALHDSAGEHSADFHRKVVLALRRDVHNGRQPRPAQQAALADLPDRVPLLGRWLGAMTEADALRARLAEVAPAALAAERAVLATTCAAEPLRRAVTLTGTDLLRGIERAARGGATPDAKARKSEPNALRYALRATAKVSPLSWFTYVAWGEWAGDDETEHVGGTPTAVVQANRTLLAKVLGAVLSGQRLRATVPHRLAPGIHVADGRLTFRRDQPVTGVDRVMSVLEEQVDLAYAGPLALLLDRVRSAGAAGAAPADLISTLASRLPGEPARSGLAAERYVTQVLDAGLLVPVEPVHPQHPGAVKATADWLAGRGETELAALLYEIDVHTGQFADTDAADRSPLLNLLKTRWEAAFALAGATWVEAPVLAEDVTVREPLRLKRAHGRDAAADLPALAALAEIFDQYLPIRRLVRDRFVALYGEGGHCRNAAEFATEMGSVWQAYNVVGPSGATEPSLAGHLTPELRELARIRAEITRAVRGVEVTDRGEAWIADDVVRQAIDDLPDWVSGRPSSYSFFVQPAAAHPRTLLVLNHVYSGWGRFTSRFLDLVAPGAARAVATQLRRTLDPSARAAQFRPVTGFNANLHPLVVPDEVGEDAAHATIWSERIALRHDPVTDQVRLYLADTGEPLDVLYLGFLVPFVMPDRTVPLHFDLSSGLVNLSHLSPVDGNGRRARLRYRDLVLSRRSWRLSAATAAEFRTSVEADGDVPADAVSRLRARYGLPNDVFLHHTGPEMRGGPEDFQKYLSQPKPQYVDFGNAVHLRNISRLLGRHEGGIRLEEALPVPGAGNPDGRVVELVLETYRKRRS